MHHISSEALVNMFSPQEIIKIVRNGIQKLADGKYHVPERMHIHRGASTNLIMPAFGEEYFCTKLISVDPDNHTYNLPVISGLLIINNNITGEALATMDAPMITALRTAAIGSIGLDLICSKKVAKLGIIGLGVQGLWQTIFAASTRNLTDIYCHTRSKDKFYSYKERINKRYPKIKITWCDTAESVVDNSEIIISCTTAKSPVFLADNQDISEKRFISVGSFAKDMQEYPAGVYKQADGMIIDSAAAKNEVGDVINTLKNGWIPPQDIFTLAELSREENSIPSYKNLVFKSVGMAAFDLALAAAVIEKVTTNKI